MPQTRKWESDAKRQAAYRGRLRDAREGERRSKGLPPAPAIASMPGTARWKAATESCRALLSMVRDEMEDYAQDRSEAWQESEKAETHQERIDAVEDILAQIEALDFG